MREGRTRHAALLLLLAFALAACLPSGAWAAGSRHSSARGAGAARTSAAAQAKARVRATSVFNRRVAALRTRAEYVSTIAARGIAGRTALLEAARTHLERLQERECRDEAACERKAARVAELESHIRLTEEHIKQKQAALQARLARIEHSRQATEERLAHL